MHKIWHTNSFYLCALAFLIKRETLPGWVGAAIWPRCWASMRVKYGCFWDFSYRSTLIPIKGLGKFKKMEIFIGISSKVNTVLSLS